MDRSRAFQASAIGDGAALAALSISSFGLFATVAENYVFSETGPNPWPMNFNLQDASWFNHAVTVLWNLNQAVLRPLFPRVFFSLLPDQDRRQAGGSASQESGRGLRGFEGRDLEERRTGDSIVALGACEKAARQDVLGIPERPESSGGGRPEATGW